MVSHCEIRFVHPAGVQRDSVHLNQYPYGRLISVRLLQRLGGSNGVLMRSGLALD